jgi:hypothetical protein
MIFGEWGNVSGGGEMNKVHGKTFLPKTDFPFKSYDKKLLSLQIMTSFPAGYKGKKLFFPNLCSQLLQSFLHMFS